MNPTDFLNRNIRHLKERITDLELKEQTKDVIKRIEVLKIDLTNKQSHERTKTK